VKKNKTANINYHEDILLNRLRGEKKKKSSQEAGIQSIIQNSMPNKVMVSM